MSNLVLVPAKKKRINPYKVVEYTGYAIAAAIVISCMAYVVVDWNALMTPGFDLPWWTFPVSMIGMVGWMAAFVGAGWLLLMGCIGVGAFYSWLREKGNSYGEVED